MRKTVLCTAVWIGSLCSPAMAAQKPPAQSSPAPQAAPATPPQADCSNLSMKEQQFASQMNAMNNRSMFCSTMTPEQRREVMYMATKPSSAGVLMSPDQAMQEYMRQNNMTPSQTPSGRNGGGCPAHS